MDLDGDGLSHGIGSAMKILNRELKNEKLPFVHGKVVFLHVEQSNKPEILKSVVKSKNLLKSINPQIR